MAAAAAEEEDGLKEEEGTGRGGGGMGRVGLGVAVGCAVAACTIAGLLVGRRVKSRRRWGRVVGVLREFEQGCATSIGRLRQVVDAMAVEMHAGLASDGGSKLKMLLTFVDTLPNGYDVMFPSSSFPSPLSSPLLSSPHIFLKFSLGLLPHRALPDSVKPLAMPTGISLLPIRILFQHFYCGMRATSYPFPVPIVLLLFPY